MSRTRFAAIIVNPHSAGHLISGFIGPGGATGSPRSAAISSFRQRCFQSSVIGVRPGFCSHRFNPPRLPISAKCAFEWLRPPNEQTRRISAAVLASTGIRTTCGGSFRVMAGRVSHRSGDVNLVSPNASGTMPRPVFRREIEVPSRRSARARKGRSSQKDTSASPPASRGGRCTMQAECVLAGRREGMPGWGDVSRRKGSSVSSV